MDNKSSIRDFGVTESCPGTVAVCPLVAYAGCETDWTVVREVDR